MRAKLTQNKGSLQCIIPKELTDRYGFKRGDEIWFEERPNEIAIQKPRMMANSEVYTIGYEGRTLNQFIERVKKANIEQLIDVREVAFSRKQGFSKASLSKALEEAGLRYRHIPELGSPGDVRYEYKNGGGLNEFMNSYRDYLATQSEPMENLKAFVMARRSILMCFERDPMACHRSVISEKLNEQGFALKHL
jgi:uncharacterized protein (DUF488 family)